MNPDDGPRDGKIDPLADPGDQVVGTIRPPSWVDTIPTEAWLFIALAAIDMVVLILREAPWSPVGVPATAVVSLVFSIVGGASIVLLPAAILVRRPSGGRAGSWLLQGAVALAAAELLGLVAQGVLDTIYGPSTFEPGLLGIGDDLLRGAAINITVTILQIFGLARIGLGLRMIGIPTRTFNRIQFAAPAAALAVLLFADLLTIQVSETTPATVAVAVQLAYNVLTVVTGAVVLVLWAWIASLASRHDARPWRWIMIGAGAIALSLVIRAIGWIVVIAWIRLDDAETALSWFGLAAGAVQAIGAAVLVAGFAGVFGPIEVDDGSEAGMRQSADPGSAARPLDA